MTSNPTEKSKALFLMFKEVVEAERRAQAMYEEIISVCEDTTLKEIFKGFYNDEVKHEKEIMNQYKQLKNLFPYVDLSSE